MESAERCANTTFEVEVQVSKQATARVPRASKVLGSSKREDFIIFEGREMRRDAIPDSTLDAGKTAY